MAAKRTRESSAAALLAVLAALVLMAVGAGCAKKLYTPEFVSAPDTVFAGDSAHLRLITTGRGYASIGYIIDWGDTVETNSSRFPLGDTATVSHVWSLPGVKQVRARASPFADLTGLTDWSESETVVVVGGGEHAPVIDTVTIGQSVAVKNVGVFFTVKTHDPDGDAVRVRFDWGTGDTTTAYFPSPCSITVGHVFAQAETAMVVVTAQDTWGATSFPETVLVSVGTAGGVVWYWRSSDPENPDEPFTTAPVIATAGTEERLYIGGDHSFYSMRTSDRKGVRKATTRWPECVFRGHPAVCEATQHIIVGSDEGELYALRLDGLREDWQWPDSPESLLTGLLWGAPAINGNRLYVASQNESIYCFVDEETTCACVSAFTPHASFVDAPAIDAQGNVCFGTDSGYLYKMGSELDTVFWRARLLANGEIHGPVIGSDGTIYCASDSFHLFAIDPTTGNVKSGWPVTLAGDVFRPAIGQSAIFAGSRFGKVYSIDPATGGINWERSLSPNDGFSTAPVVAANGYVYFQDDADMLYCLAQADGRILWICDCPSYLPHVDVNAPRPRRTQLTDYAPNPTICANGNIIVLGRDACYCVGGYPEGPLDPLAPWPKWQHDLYNTGHVGGGR
jgi:outer membrane protein assembly factor BamB